MQQVCKDCGSVGDAKTVARGAFWVEVVLWLCFLVPGLIYSIWRLSSKHEACAACGSERLLPVSTPVGQKLVAESGHIAQSGEAIKPPSKTAINVGRALGRAVGRLTK